MEIHIFGLKEGKLDGVVLKDTNFDIKEHKKRPFINNEHSGPLVIFIPRGVEECHSAQNTDDHDIESKLENKYASINGKYSEKDHTFSIPVGVKEIYEKKDEIKTIIGCFNLLKRFKVPRDKERRS